MPGPFIAVLERSTGKFGWSSVYYPIAADYDSAVNAADLINTREMGLLPSLVISGLVRVSDMTVRGDSRVIAPTTPAGTFAEVGPPAGAAYDPNHALGMKFLSGASNRATHYLRGLPPSLVSLVNARLVFTPSAPWVLAQGAFNTAVTNAFNIMSRVGGPPPILTPHVITNTVLFQQNEPVNLSIRRAGRPFDLPRGRARAG